MTAIEWRQMCTRDAAILEQIAFHSYESGRCDDKGLDVCIGIASAVRQGKAFDVEEFIRRVSQ